MNHTETTGARRIRVVALAAALVVLSGGSGLWAQGSVTPLRVSVAQENLRATPGGTRLASVLKDAPLRGGATRDQWREVTLDAWIAEASVVPTTRDGFTLAVAPGGASLHGQPDGPVVARGLGGFLLDEVARRDGWVRVRRTAWMWAPSLAAAPAPAATATDGDRSADAAPRADAPAPPRLPRTLHATPGGPQMGTVAPGASMEVVGQEGEWARVRVEGWVRVGANGSANGSAPLHDVSLRALREDPEQYRGRSLAWRVQFIAVQRADSLRTDFTPGENYILARDPGGEPGFVYIAVPPAQLAAARRLVPLQQVEVVGRVRTGRSALMGHPVLELLELRP